MLSDGLTAACMMLAFSAMVVGIFGERHWKMLGFIAYLAFATVASLGVLGLRWAGVGVLLALCVYGALSVFDDVMTRRMDRPLIADRERQMK